MKFPEHEKLGMVSKESQSIGQFLDWLTNDRGIVLCNPTESWDHSYVPIYKPFQYLLAEYFKIDLDKIEEEKLEMLELCRNRNEKSN